MHALRVAFDDRVKLWDDGVKQMFDQWRSAPKKMSSFSSKGSRWFAEYVHLWIRRGSSGHLTEVAMWMFFYGAQYQAIVHVSSKVRVLDDDNHIPQTFFSTYRVC